MSRKLWLVGMGAALTLIVAAAPALAEALNSWLIPSQRLGYYGTDVSLTPVVATTVLPGDQVEFQTYSSATGWQKYGENQSVEETGVLDPMWVRIDEHFTYPVKLRALFRSKASAGATDSVSPTVTLNKLKYPATRTRLSIDRTIDPDKATTVGLRVSPNPGPGKATVKIYRKAGMRWQYVKTRTVTLDELGTGSFKLEPAYATSYKLVARFVGNRFSVPSASTVVQTTAR